MSLGLRPGMGVNQQIVLPRGIAAAEEINRTLVISAADQQVPTAVRTWMIADPRYNGWFLDGAPLPSPQGAVVDVVNNPANSAPPNTPSNTEGQTGIDPDETWREADVVPVLREYAKRHGVELKSDDKKDDIVAKLREARGAFEVTPPDESGETPSQ